MLTSNDKVIIYAQDSFNTENAKTAIGFIRYSSSEIIGIVDRKIANKTASDIFSFLPKIPIFDSIESAKNFRNDANTLLIGIASPGGKFPPEWIPDMIKAIKLKLNIVNGLHDFLSDLPEIKMQALKENIFIWDVRKVAKKLLVANARLLAYPIKIILTVGTDAAVGKMTVSLELTKSANNLNKSAKFIATGQTGIMISGDGVPVDAVISDFVSGAIEEEIINAAKNNFSFAFVEGQGSILHPAWSGVTLSLLHGALPHKLILCHEIGREYLKNTNIKINSLSQFIKIYEDLSLPVRKAKVAGVALNTKALDQLQMQNVIKSVEDKINLPVDDVVKNTGEKLLKACLN